MKNVFVTVSIVILFFFMLCLYSCSNKPIIVDAPTQPPVATDTAPQTGVQPPILAAQQDSVQAATQTPVEITPQDESILISTRNISDGVQNSWYEDFEYPFFEGGTNDGNVLELNNEISEFIEGCRIDDEIKNRDEEQIGYAGIAESTVEYEVLCDGPDYIIIQLFFYCYYGGAHGYHSLEYLTFDARTGEKYSIDYFVKDIPDYKNKINDYLINKCMVAMQEDQIEINLSNVPLRFDGTENYYYDESSDKLIIEYGNYTLSSYATQFNTIEVRLNFLRDNVTVEQKIFGEWHLDKTTDKSGNDSDYIWYLQDAGATDVYIRFDNDGNFYKRYQNHPIKWEHEGTYFVNGNAINLKLNADNNKNSLLFWRKGEREIAYLDLESETIQYRTNWSAENNEVVYCIFE